MEWILHPGQLTDILGIPTGEVGDLTMLDGTSHLQPSENRPRLKRPHTKSRRGCLNCKKRKVKCQETKPACTNCLSRDMKCTYPSPTTEDESLELSIAGANSLINTEIFLSGPFTGEDLRFFQHFLTVSRPHLPFGSEQSWITDVPAYAHECPHLMHAILSLGATHYDLTIPSNSRYNTMAISHRGKALKFLSLALADIDSCSAASLDGILATCYALVFQAYYMNDGVIDFAVMNSEEVMQLIEPWLSKDMHPNQDDVNLCIRDIEQLRPFIHDGSTLCFFESLLNTYLAFQHSIQDAFCCLGDVYKVWHSMENQNFMNLITSTNIISRALFLHYFAIDTLMRPFLLHVRGHKHPSLSVGAIVMEQWADAAYYGLPGNIQRLVKHEVNLVRREKENIPLTLRNGS
ncbi:unnamed protein product [Penicillium pancosmium]